MAVHLHYHHLHLLLLVSSFILNLILAFWYYASSIYEDDILSSCEAAGYS